MHSANVSRWLKTWQCDISVSKFGRRTPKLPNLWKHIISIFGERSTILNFKVEKRSSNFYRANGDTRGDFQTESVLKCDVRSSLHFAVAPRWLCRPTTDLDAWQWWWAWDSNLWSLTPDWKDPSGDNQDVEGATGGWLSEWQGVMAIQPRHTAATPDLPPHWKITRAFIWRLTEHNMSYKALHNVQACLSWSERGTVHP